MKTLILLLILVTFGVTLNAQKRTTIIDSIGKLDAIVNKERDSGNYTSAIATYKLMQKITEPGTEAYEMAAFDIGNIYLALNNDSAAKSVYIQVLNSHSKRKDSPNNDFTMNPASLSKHTACVELADIELKERHYKEALKYINLSDKTYSYTTFCGNAWADAQAYTASMYADAYLGLHDTTHALQHLLSQVFSFNLVSDNIILPKTMPLLKAKYKASFLKQALDKSIDSLYVKKTITEYNHRKDTVVQYCVRFLGAIMEVPLPLDVQHIVDDNIEDYKDFARKSDFYTSISKLSN
jgi:hypothetical protein